MTDKKSNNGAGNTGNRNSGDYNSGDYNSGNRNSGYCNSGDYNSGNRNSGDYNSGNRNSGYFNTDSPTVRMFNRDTGKSREEIDLPCVDLKIEEWVSESKMTDAQKADDPDFHVKGGTLITRSYKDAWRLYWSKASDEDKQRFLALPNFDSEIFKEITGIDVGKKEVNCEGKVVEIDGKKYKLTEV